MRTIGVVLTLARADKVPLSPCGQKVYDVRDRIGGGADQAIGRPEPTDFGSSTHSPLSERKTP